MTETVVLPSYTLEAAVRPVMVKPLGLTLFPEAAVVTVSSVAPAEETVIV